MFAIVVWIHVTIFWIFWLLECLNSTLKFHLKVLFQCKSNQTLIHSRYGGLNSSVTNFSRHTCLLTSFHHDIIPMAYDPYIFVLKYFLNRFVMLRFYSIIYIKHSALTQILFPRHSRHNRLWVIVQWITMKTCRIPYENTCRTGFLNLSITSGHPQNCGMHIVKTSSHWKTFHVCCIDSIILKAQVQNSKIMRK